MQRSLSRFLILTWMALFVVVPVSAQQAPLPNRVVDATGFEEGTDGLTPLDVARIQQVTSVVVTSDGQHAAFTLAVQADPREENAPSRSQVFVLDVESGETTPYATRGNARALAIRPGSNAITFLDRLGDAETTSLYQVPLAGGEAVEIFSFETSISSYDWSPDGQTLAFVASNPDHEEMETDLPYAPEIYEEGLKYAYAYVADLSADDRSADDRSADDRSADDRSAGADAQKVSMDGHVSRLAWSPTGDRMAVVAAPTPLVDDFYMDQSISIVDASSLEVVGTVDHDAKLGPMAFSPDGSQLAFIAGADIHDPIDGRLFVVSADGGSPQNLQPDFEGKFESVRWQDDQTIHFLASEGVHATLGAIGPDGSGMERILSGDGPNLLSVDAANGTHVFIADHPSHPRELYVLRDGENLERATHHNPWLADKATGEQEVFTYTARDGLELQGLLIRPTEMEEGERVPLITVVHGGPEAHYDDGWLTAYSMAGQMAAARGYAVFYPNYRGSTGRGVEFAKSSQADLAGKEFDDIVDGVDALIESGLVDGDRVGVTGGSYGGYATGWLSTRYTDRFAAGVMFVGISDNISKWGTSDIPEELYLVHARERIWEDYQGFLERSPIYHAGEAKTPLLIMHGKEDPRVHPSQSLEMYRHIKTRTDTPVRLVYYPGEGHGNRAATARLDYNLRMLRWFDRYLNAEQAIGAR